MSTGPDLDLATIAGWVAGARRVTVLTGAGISTESGIPDFRGPNGVWTRNPAAQRTVTLDAYVADPEVRRTAWRNRRDHPAWHARPNHGHRALVDLERSGRLAGLITQNIDGLHQRAGSDPALVIEVHGTLFAVECLRCGARTAMTEALARVAAGEDDPACRGCGGILKAATISFGQPLVPEVLAAARDAAAACDVFLAIGSTLSVQPAAGCVEVAARAGARVVIVNAAPTPYDGIADAVVRGAIGAVLPVLVAGTATRPVRHAADAGQRPPLH
jgi:NAD-dependent deacetylase